MIPLPANLLARFALLAGVALALYAATWWVAIKPRAELASERQAHAETRVAHAEVLTGLAEAAAEVARKASAARVAFAEARAKAESDYNEGVANAYERGRATAAGIAAGTVRVREVWRDCPAAPAGEGAGPAGRPADVSANRGEAIGRVLGIGGEADAAYARAIARLTAAQQLVDACHEEPAR